MMIFPSDLHTLLSASAADRRRGGTANPALHELGAPLLAQDEAWDACDEPDWLGKGTLQCAVLDASGAVTREVSVKARMEPSSGLVVLQGPAWLLRGAQEPAALDFDPCSQADPLSGERYTAFCYCDEAGKSLSMNPSSRTVRPQDWQAPATPPGPSPT